MLRNVFFHPVFGYPDPEKQTRELTSTRTKTKQQEALFMLKNINCQDSLAENTSYVKI